MSEFRSLQFLGVFSDYELVYHVLDIAVDKGLKIIYGIVDAVVGDAPLRIVVGADFAERSPVLTIVLRREAMSSMYF